MGLKCLLGHDFGEREVERDRREEGDEVVVVYRTVENCRRCGTRRVVTENKEVRSIRDAAAAAAGDGETADAPDDATPTVDEGPSTPDGAGDAGDRGRTRADADPEPADPPAGSLLEAAEAVGARDTDDGDDASADPAGDDDAVILGGPADDPTDDSADDPTDDSADDPTDADAGTDGADAARPEQDGDRESTADPDTNGSTTAGSGAELLDAGDAGSNGTDGDGAWPAPDPDAEDEGFDATPHEDADSGVDFGGGLTPTDANHAAYVGTDEADDEDEGFVRTEHREVVTDGPTEFRCPNCGSTRTARDSSLRAGDVCPDCRKGYVAERAVEE